MTFFWFFNRKSREDLFSCNHKSTSSIENYKILQKEHQQITSALVSAWEKKNLRGKCLLFIFHLSSYLSFSPIHFSSPSSFELFYSNWCNKHESSKREYLTIPQMVNMIKWTQIVNWFPMEHQMFINEHRITMFTVPHIEAIILCHVCIATHSLCKCSGSVTMARNSEIVISLKRQLCLNLFCGPVDPSEAIN